MTLRGLHASFRRINQEHPAWKLLRAQNSPLILSFVDQMFREAKRVQTTVVRAALAQELAGWQDHSDDPDENESRAAQYLRSWCHEGWLMEQDNSYSATDATLQALRFVQGIDRRDSSLTESNLRFVQEAVNDLALRLSGDTDQQLQALYRKQKEVSDQISELLLHGATPLSQREQKDGVRAVYRQASALTGDFRALEELIRGLYQEVTVRMKTEGQSRGDVIALLMEQEQAIEASDAGLAFTGFFDLVTDPNRSQEFRERLKTIVSHPAAKHLDSDQVLLLKHLVKELNNESSRVLETRRHMEARMRAYLESGHAEEDLALEALIARLEAKAIELKEVGIRPNAPTSLRIADARVRVDSPTRYHAKQVEQPIDVSAMEVHENSAALDAGDLEHLATVRVVDLAGRALSVIRQQGGTASVGQIVRQFPIRKGLAELVGYLNLAELVKGVATDMHEEVVVAFPDGYQVTAKLPMYLMGPEGFPNDLETLEEQE